MAVAIATHLVVAGNRAWDDVNANIGGDNIALVNRLSTSQRCGVESH